MGIEPGRISFSSDFLDESNFISICPNPQAERDAERARETRNFISICPNPRAEREMERARETRNFISICPNPRLEGETERARENRNFISICPNPRAEREMERARETRNFISICPNPRAEREAERARETRNANFEFLSGNVRTSMMSADELFRGGKLLPSWQTHHADKLNRISLKPESNDIEPKKIERIGKIEDSRINWFVDDDPSPRPPKCTLLWKELLKLKKQHRPPPTLSSPSISSSSLSSSSRASLADVTFANEKESAKNKEREKSEKRMKKGQERTKSTSIRIRPVLNVRICSQAKDNVLPPLFSLRKGR